MSGEFKQCPNGHYYQGETCPYCRTGNSSNTSSATEIFISGAETDRTQTTHSSASSGDTTTFVDTPISPGKRPTNRTVFGDEETIPINQPSGTPVSPKQPRYGRKLVGWLVTYSHDELGNSYNLYEGRNIIGRDNDCSIIINDSRMSGKHAVLLYRANKYSLTDSQSSHGTFVNDEDIELEPRYLKDGDIIKMGTTIFKFRSSL